MDNILNNTIVKEKDYQSPFLTYTYRKDVEFNKVGAIKVNKIILSNSINNMFRQHSITTQLVYLRYSNTTLQIFISKGINSYDRIDIINQF